MNNDPQNGKLIIFSAPSGSGKTTIVKWLLTVFPDIKFSVSACSRPKRIGEEDGKDYYFLTEEIFRKKIADNEFIEWEEVYPGHFYGTLKSELERLWNNGFHIIFDVDVMGGLRLKRQYPENSLAIFVQTPSLEELEKRLRKRSTETEDSLRRRLGKARKELTYASQFDIILINDKLDNTFADAEQIVSNFINKI